MGKRTPQIRSNSKSVQKDDQLEDLISQMPELVLANILSLLELREAGRSSVLSRRWRDLWKLTTVINFDDSEAKKDPRGAKISGSKYISWVDQVIELHQWPHLDELRVQFVMKNGFSSSIDKLVKFSIQKGAKRLKILLPTYDKCKHYTLSQECYACFTSPSNLHQITRLMSLSLRDVDINGQLIQYLLQKCPLLEYVYIRGSNHLVDLQVVGPLLKLKHLEIRQCSFMESLELFAPKLVTFKYYGNRLNSLCVGNLPLLSDVYLASDYGRLTSAFVAFSSNFSHIETLQLDMSWVGYGDFPLLQELRNLKTLFLDIWYYNSYGKSILRLSKLIESAPSLQTFTLEIHRNGNDETMEDEMFTSFKPCPHLSLKHVELIGLKATKDEILFVEYLIESAIAIEMVIIHTCSKKDAITARRCAYELKNIAPPRAKFFVK